MDHKGWKGKIQPCARAAARVEGEAKCNYDFRRSNDENEIFAVQKFVHIFEEFPICARFSNNNTYITKCLLSSQLESERPFWMSFITLTFLLIRVLKTPYLLTHLTLRISYFCQQGTSCLSDLSSLNVFF